MVRLLLILLLFASCCPKITENTKIIKKSDTVTVYLTDTVLVPEKVDTFALDLGLICDSLFNVGKSGGVSLESDKGVTVSIQVDESGGATIVTGCDSLVMVIDSLRQVTTVTDTIKITETKVVTKYKKRGKWWMWLLGGVTIGLVGSIILRR